MRKLRLAVFMGGTILFGASSLLAQDAPNKTGSKIKSRTVPADRYEQLRDAATPAATGEETLSHGDLLTIRRAGNNTLNGVLVYQDNDRLFVRPRPNATPVAIARKDIEEIERIVPASTVGDKNGEKGGIQFAIDTARRRNSEIETLEVYNGTTRTVRYYGKTLSPAEREQLANLERAANRQAYDAALVQSLSDQLERGPERVNLAELVRILTPAQPPAFASASLNTLYPVGPNLTSNGNPYGFGGGGFSGVGGGSNLATLALLPAILNGMNGPATAPAILDSTNRPTTSPAELTKSLNEARENLAKSREAYAQVANRAIRDNDGRIVAVRLETK